MGLFGKKTEEKANELPELPELPPLPSLTETRLNKYESNRLPQFPINSLGEKISQDTIKDAISGKKEDDTGAEADEFDSDEEFQMMQEPLKTPSTIEMDYEESPITNEIPTEFREAAERVRKTEPVFIRLDKFHESMLIFQNARKKISEISNLMGDIKKLKEQEEKELEIWEQEIKSINNEIEKINKEIFSKVE